MKFASDSAPPPQTCRRSKRRWGAILALSLSLSGLSFHSAIADAQEEIATMPGIAAWYRADAVKQDADHSMISWPDSSANARVITPDGAAPKVIPNALNGLPVVRFEGKEGALIEATNWTQDGYTVFAVASFDAINEKPEVSQASEGQILVSDGGRGGLSLGLNWNGRPGLALGIPLDSAQILTAKEPPYLNHHSSDIVVNPNQFYVFSFGSEQGRTKASGTDCWSDLHIQVNHLANPSQLDVFFNVQDYGHFGDTKLQIGSGGGRAPLVGDIAEILIFNGKLSDADAAKVRSYLSAKYKIADPVEYFPALPVSIYPHSPSGPFWFKDSAVVYMESQTQDATIHYTTDGSEPTEKSPTYTGPVTLDKSATVKARAFAANRKASETTAAEFSPISEIPAPTKVAATGGWEYSWGDEFNGPVVDKKLWTFEIKGERNAEAQYFTDRPENTFFQDGKIVLKAIREKYEDREYTSSSITTEHNRDLTYGRYEARMKVDTHTGSWPAWWVFAKPEGKWPRDGEIDMLEYYMGRFNFNLLNGKEQWGAERKKLSDLGGKRWADEFHVWMMDWDETKIDLYLDGVLINHYPLEKADGTGRDGQNPFQHPENLKMLFTQSVGGLWGGPANEESYELQVDYLRVYKWSDSKAYRLTVNNGAGGGEYVPGKGVAISATALPYAPEQKFIRWITNVPEAAIDNPTSPSALLTMPSSNITVTALFSDSKADEKK